jgi:FtsP/CotA-like multicopper oxidase with cupredoxin domain
MKFLPFAGILLWSFGVAEAQHEGHQMHHAPEGDPKEWRMAPHDYPMPPLPGLENPAPPVAPFLPGMDATDLSIYPEAEPARTVELSDGETFGMTASIVRRTIGGRTFLMYGYNGQYPGPLLKAARGSKVIVKFTNEIEMPTTVHWHGLRLDNRFDGIPDLTQAPVLPRGTFTYELSFPDTGVYWYHPHVREDVQQDLGLYGNMLVSPEAPDYYNPVNREVALILDDVLIDELGLFPWGGAAPTHALMGRFGNVMLVNGTTDYALSVRKGEVVRFFLTNVANARTFNVVFGGSPVKVIASDVSKFEREERVESVVIAPAERYVVEVLFEKAGEVPITNSIQAIDGFMGEFRPRVVPLGIVRVEDAAVEESHLVAFENLRVNEDVRSDVEAYRKFFDKPVDRRLELVLDVENLPTQILQAMQFEAGLYSPPVEWNDGMPEMNFPLTSDQVHWTLRDPDTGKENMDIEWVFRTGEVVKIRIFNDPRTIHPMNHPIHLHGQRYLVLSLDGVPNDNLVWKDTAIVPVGATVDLLVDMSNPGKWMLHCHIAEHLHSGMMSRFTVSP